MRNVSISQILLFFFLLIFIFGDFKVLKKSCLNLYKKYINDNRKKGS